MKDGLQLNKRRIKLLGNQSAVYHCISRTIAGEQLFGDMEKEVLRSRIHKLAQFCGVEVLTYCILSNHFHLLVRVPPRDQTDGLSQAELLRRVEGYYEKSEAASLRERLEGPEGEEARECLLKRMGDVSEYLKELKQGFSRWYNRTHERFGTLWSERFKSVLVEGCGVAIRTVSAYIDLNPVRAGLCEDPKEYRWCGYAEACAGSSVSRRGLCRVWELKEARWREVLSAYRMYLFGRGSEVVAGKQAGIPIELAKKVRERGGQLNNAAYLRCRVDYFTAGAILGSKLYVESMWRQCVGRPRKSGANRLKGAPMEHLYSLRNLRNPLHTT